MNVKLEWKTYLTATALVGNFFIFLCPNTGYIFDKSSIDGA